jgi:hypothetical protein
LRTNFTTKKLNPRDKGFIFRVIVPINSEDNAWLDLQQEKIGIPRTETIRRALKLYRAAKERKKVEKALKFYGGGGR